jgi:hypothetical protein
MELMLKAFHIFALLLVAIAMALSLAHTLEFPGKLRLGKDAYLAVQQIYYPGFTIGGFVGEFGGMLALAALLFLLPAGQPFWWAVISFLFLVASHAVYWLLTHPVNGFWLKDFELSGLGSTFFSLFVTPQSADWQQLRDVWEYSHVARACLAMLSFLAAAISLSLA